MRRRTEVHNPEPHQGVYNRDSRFSLHLNELVCCALSLTHQSHAVKGVGCFPIALLHMSC